MEKNDAGQRLDRFIKKIFPKMSKHLLAKFIRTKRIKVNKKRQEASYMVQENDRIQIYLYEEVLAQYEDRKIYSADDFDLDVIYEDDNIIVMNKQRNLLTHAASAEDYGKTLVDRMISYLIKTKAYLPGREQSFVPAVVNRLDRNTTGLVVGCKTANSLRYFNAHHDCLSKYYECIVKGRPSVQIITEELVKDEKNVVHIAEGGKESRTEILEVEPLGDFSRVKICLHTGRTHQIRIHLSHIGCPIIGDTKYGISVVNAVFRKKYGLTSQLLNAYMLKIQDVTDEFSYLSGKVFQSFQDPLFQTIYEDIK